MHQSVVKGRETLTTCFLMHKHSNTTHRNVVASLIFSLSQFGVFKNLFFDVEVITHLENVNIPRIIFYLHISLCSPQHLEKHVNVVNATQYWLVGSHIHIVNSNMSRPRKYTHKASCIRPYCIWITHNSLFATNDQLLDKGRKFNVIIITCFC